MIDVFNIVICRGPEEYAAIYPNANVLEQNEAQAPLHPDM